MKRLLFILPLVASGTMIDNWFDNGYRINGQYIINIPIYQPDFANRQPQFILPIPPPSRANTPEPTPIVMVLIGLAIVFYFRSK